MSYSPSLVPGEPGRIIMDPDASYSAWLHEVKHANDDKMSGWQGMRLLEDTEAAVKMEDAAYQLEIDFARQYRYDKIVKRLERLRFERRQELYGKQKNYRSKTVLDDCA